MQLGSTPAMAVVMIRAMVVFRRFSSFFVVVISSAVVLSLILLELAVVIVLFFLKAGLSFDIESSVVPACGYLSFVNVDLLGNVIGTSSFVNTHSFNTFSTHH